jgi:predicted RecA/RadA family phage recombinase
MGAVFKHDGNAIDYTPTADVSSGDVVVRGELVGVAKLDIKTGELGALHVTGVFDFPKAAGAGTAIAAGAKVYWDATAKVATPDDATGANKLVGKAVSDAVDDDTTVRVRLSQ